MVRPNKTAAAKGSLDPFAAMSKLAVDLEAFAAQPDVTGYHPHPKQKAFHAAPTKGRLFLGGNRAGKTTAGVVEDIFWLKQDHPYRDLSGSITRGIPTRGRVVVIDFNMAYLVVIPEYKRWIPPSLLKGGSWDRSWDKVRSILTLENGATLDFKTYEQEMDKHSGASRNFVHFDEEMPEHIYNENMLRLLDTNGQWWCTMTPLLGVTWLYEKFDMDEHPDEEEYTSGVRKNEDGSDAPNTGVYVARVNTKENPHLSEEAITATFEGMSEDEVKSRQEGRFVEVGGLVFKTFDPKAHVIDPMIPPKTWELYMSLDSGWNNPTAILWHAVSPEGDIITFGEHYASEMTIAQHCAVIKQKEAGWGWVPAIRTGDPATKQTREVTGTSVQQEYAQHGIYLALDSVPTGPGSVAIGIQKMQAYLGNKRLATGVTTPVKWKITSDCYNFIKEMRKLRWATYSSRNLQATLNAQEQVHKKDDHTFDSARYFVSFLPDLKPSSVGSLNPATQKPRTWQEELIWREQQEAAGELLTAYNNTLWRTSEEYF